MIKIKLMLTALIIQGLSIFAYADDCVEKVCIGSVYIDSKNRVGVVQQINGQEVTMRIYEYRRTYKTLLSDLTPTVNEHKGIKPEMSVVGDTASIKNKMGLVKYVFPDGRVLIGHSQVGIHVLTNVSKEVPSYGHIKKGGLIAGRRDRIGIAEAVYADGRVYYKPGRIENTSEDGSFQIRLERTERVSREVSGEVARGGEGNSLYAGVLVVDSENRMGKVLRVFADGRVLFTGSSLATSKVSPEVNYHSEYNKDESYANSEHMVGTVLNFFKDGKVNFDSGYGTSKIESVLYKRVSSFNQYDEGSIVAMPGGNLVPINEIYANGTITFNGDTKSPKIYSAKIFDPDVSGFYVDKQMVRWILSLSGALDGKKYFYYYPTIVIDASQHKALKASLLEFLKYNHVSFSKESRKRVIEFLSRP